MGTVSYLQSKRQPQACTVSARPIPDTSQEAFRRVQDAQPTEEQRDAPRRSTRHPHLRDPPDAA
jgi:hypothetical protein